MFRILVVIFAILTAVCASAGEDLPSGAIRRLGSDTARDPLRGVYLVAFSPNGKLLATRGRDQVVRIWDVETGNEQFALSEHEDRVTSLAFSLDSRTLATSSPGTGEVVRLWDTATGKKTKELNRGGTYVNFLPDGKSLLVVDAAKATYYDAHTFEEKKSDALGLRPSIIPLALSPDGISLAFYRAQAGNDGHSGVFVRDIRNAGLVHVERPEGIPVIGQFSPDGKQLVVSCRREEMIHIVKLGDLKSNAIKRAHDAQTQSVAFTPDSRLMATASWDKTVRLWDVLTGEVVATLPGHTEHVCAVAFSTDGKRLASGASGPTDNSTLLWDVYKVLFGNQQEPAKLTDEEMPKVWEDLAQEPSRAFHAMAKLVRAPKSSAPHLIKRVKEMVPTFDAETIERLIAELDSDKFQVREAAQRKLIDLRVIAEVQLRKALQETESFEVKARIKQILAQTKSEKKLTQSERRRIHRMIHAMELIGTQEMKQQLVKIASGFPNSEIITVARATAERISAHIAEIDERD